MGNVTGSEASVTILYDLDYFHYEHLTRAKTQLVIVTIDGKQSELSIFLQYIEKGFHDDKGCKEHYKGYKRIFGQELPCQFKGNKSKIRNLIRKVHINADGSVNLTMDYFNELVSENRELKKKN